jgi:nitroimidazol reductase NimA-like FMN-containing flavoprotein (pyridoxamine 5'-phosphate oxidase superfamily)
MTLQAPASELSSVGTSANAKATSWTEAEEQLRTAEVYWLTTVRPDGRPHVTPLIAVWMDAALYFCAGDPDRKWKDLTTNQNVVLTTGNNAFRDTLDIVVEGEAVVVRDDAKVRRLGDAFEAKYGKEWRLPGMHGNDVFEVAPTKVFGFGRGDAKGLPPQGGFSQTRWRF